MNYRVLGKTNWNVSELGLGCGTHVENWNIDEEKNFEKTVKKAVEAGMNFFDTADQYFTEKWLGRALGSYRRNVYIATKVGKYASNTGHPLSYAVPEHIYLCCEASLNRLKTDYIDLYFCHLDNPENLDVFVQAFKKLKAEGKIRHYGISTNYIDVLKKFNVYGDCAACECDYNILRTKPEEELFPYCRNENIGVIVRRPLEKGILSGKLGKDTLFSDWVRKRWNTGTEHEEYIKKISKVEELKDLENEDRNLVQIALKYILHNDTVACVIPGASKPERLDDYVRAPSIPFTEEEYSNIKAAIKSFH